MDKLWALKKHSWSKKVLKLGPCSNIGPQTMSNGTKQGPMTCWAEGPMVQQYALQNMRFSYFYKPLATWSRVLPHFSYLFFRGKLVSVGPQTRWALGHGLLGLLANPALLAFMEWYWMAVVFLQSAGMNCMMKDVLCVGFCGWSIFPLWQDVLQISMMILKNK